MGRLGRIIQVYRTGGARELAFRAERRWGRIPRRGTPTGLTCTRPFHFISIGARGEVSCCCPGWVRYPLGRLDGKHSLLELWNGQRARAFRRAMASSELDRVCRVDVCPEIIAGRLPRLEDGPIDTREVLSHPPTSVEIAVDPRCNLACPSCRAERIVQVTEDEQALLERCLTELAVLSGTLEWLHLLGSGEVFFSGFCLDLLRSLDRETWPRLKVAVLTNGQLLDGRAWQRLGTGAAFIKEISVSIDAATEKTYGQVRPGADWDRLKRNLKFIAGLRESRAIDALEFNFVVSAGNYLEMPAFVRLGERYAADQVTFTALQPNSGMPLDHKAHAVHLPGHKLHTSLLAVLDDPLLKQPHVVVGLPSP